MDYTYKKLNFCLKVNRTHYFYLLKMDPLIATAAPLAATAAPSLDLERNISKAKWDYFMQVLHILIFAGGQVFGGCPRDMVYRRYHDKSYMEYCRAHHADNCKVFYDTHYNDLNVHPESAQGRNLVPADIDCFFRNQGMRSEALELLKTLGSSNRPYQPSYLLNNNPKLKDDLHQESYKIKMALPKATKWFLGTVMGEDLVKKLTDQIIKIDMLTYISSPFVFMRSKHMYSPPFGLNKDFNVNQLSMVYNHVSSGEQVVVLTSTMADDDKPFLTLDKIQEGILTKKAVACKSVCDNHRILKMVKKGYTIQFTSPPFGQCVSVNDDDQCVICLAKIKTTDEHGSYQPCVCAAKYHLVCFAECFLRLSEENRVKCQYCRAHLQYYGHYCDFWKQICLYSSARQQYLGEPVAEVVYNNCQQCS